MAIAVVSRSVVVALLSVLGPAARRRWVGEYAPPGGIGRSYLDRGVVDVKAPSRLPGCLKGSAIDAKTSFCAALTCLMTALTCLMTDSNRRFPPYHVGSGAVKPDTAWHSRARCACNSKALWMSDVLARVRACSVSCTRLVPAVCCLIANGQRALARLAVQPPIGSLRMRSLVGSMTTTAPSLSSCSTAARFASRSAACCSGRLLNHGESARPRGIRAGGSVAFRIAQTIRVLGGSSLASRPSRLARPKICPHDLSPRQHPRRGRAEAARRLRGRRIRSPREVERFLDGEPAADLRGAGDLVG